MHHQARRLVEHQQVGIFVEDGKRNGLRQRYRGNRGRRRQAVERAGADGFGGGADGAAVAAGEAGLDEGFHPRAGEGGKVLGEEAVDALPGGLGGCPDGVDACIAGGFVGHAVVEILPMAGQVEGRRMRALVVAVVAMGVLIVIGGATLGVMVARRAAVPPPAVQNAVLDEPAGTRIAAMSALPDRLALQLAGGGPDRVVVVDLRTGQVVGRAALAR